MKIFKNTAIFTLLSFFACAATAQNMQVDISSDDETMVTIDYNATAAYSSPPFNFWNGQLLTLKWPESLGSGLIASVTGDAFPYALDGVPVLENGFYYQKINANVTNFALSFNAGETKTVANIVLNDNGGEAASTLEIAGPGDSWAMANNGVPAVVNFSTNQFEGFINSSAAILPIKLHTFTAQKDRDNVQLDWITESEVNGSHFDVQRSRDLETWTTIGTVDAVGESSSKQSYAHLDTEVPLYLRDANKTFYYRLNMVDNDGSQEYSEVRVVRFDQEEASFIVYPNPSINEVFVNLSSITAETGPATMNVVNLQGASVKKVTLSTNDDISVDISTLQAGAYFFLVKQGEETFAQKVIKVD